MHNVIIIFVIIFDNSNYYYCIICFINDGINLTNIDIGNIPIEINKLNNIEPDLKIILKSGIEEIQERLNKIASKSLNLENKCNELENKNDFLERD